MFRGSDNYIVITSFEKALDLFTMSPHLGDYVRDGLNPFHDRRAEESVLRVLRMTSNITLLGVVSNGGTFGWDMIPRTMGSLLADTAHGPTVRSMSLERFTGVPTSFILSPSLRVL